MYRRYPSKYIVSVILATIVLLLIEEIGARPSTSSITVDDCEISSDTRILCQRCAKVTKSPVVYPMCCINYEKAKQWCSSYLGYGKQHIKQNE